MWMQYDLTTGARAGTTLDEIIVPESLINMAKDNKGQAEIPEGINPDGCRFDLEKQIVVDIDPPEEE